MSLVRAIRAISRRTGSKPLMMTVSGVSSMIRSIARRLLECANVAPLAADDAALHLVRRQVDRGHCHLCRVVGHHALDGGDDDIARLVVGLVARLGLDRAGQPHGILLGLAADLLDQNLLGVVLRHLADLLERGDLLLARGGKVFLGMVELVFAGEQLAVALLEHVGALVELLVALQQPTLQACRQVRRRARPSVLFGLACESDLLVLGLKDQLLLLGCAPLPGSGPTCPARRGSTATPGTNVGRIQWLCRQRWRSAPRPPARRGHSYSSASHPAPNRKDVCRFVGSPRLAASGDPTVSQGRETTLVEPHPSASWATRPLGSVAADYVLVRKATPV